MLRSLTANSLCFHTVLGIHVSNAHAVYKPAAEQLLQADRRDLRMGWVRTEPADCTSTSHTPT
jgi:hypothetical protein